MRDTVFSKSSVHDKLQPVTGMNFKVKMISKVQLFFARSGSAPSSLIMYAVPLLCLASLAGSQAPGDGDQVCIDSNLHPEYEDHMHPLMDSRDYIQVWPRVSNATGVWQKLDLDDSNPPAAQTEVVNKHSFMVQFHSFLM